MAKGDTLTSKQKLFVEEYLRCWNATEAARRAGYSEKTARVIGGVNLAKVAIADAIKRRIAETAMSADEVLIRLARHARGSISDFVDENGAVSLKKAKESGNLDLVKSYNETAHGIRIELHDAQAALVHLGRHHKLFTDSVNVTAEVAVKGYTQVSPDDWD